MSHPHVDQRPVVGTLVGTGIGWGGVAAGSAPLRLLSLLLFPVGRRPGNPEDRFEVAFGRPDGANRIHGITSDPAPARAVRARAAPPRPSSPASSSPRRALRQSPHA